MDLQRVVELHFRGRPLGSGYLITSRHVLTARHVADPPAVGISCKVYPLTVTEGRVSASISTKPFPAKVGWVAKSATRDLAIIEIKNPDRFPFLAALQPVEFGRVPFSAAAWNWLVTGFPEASDRDDRTIDAKLRWVGRSRLFDVDVESKLPRDWKKWAGFSGAVLFWHDFAVAVICTVDENFEGLLAATPIQFLLEDEDFLKYWNKQRQPALSIRTLDHDPATLPGWAPEKQLPRPDIPSRTTIFTGRQAQLDRLDMILTGDQAPGTQPTERAAAQLRRAAVHGMGGLGKTSLALEYVHRYRDSYSVVWWCKATTRTRLLERLAELGKVLRTAAAEEADVEKAAREALRHLSDQSGNYLLVYDGVPGPDEIKDLYPAAGASVLITSRFSDWNEWAEPVALCLLSEAEAIAILERRSGRRGSGRCEEARRGCGILTTGPRTRGRLLHADRPELFRGRL